MHATTDAHHLPSYCRSAVLMMTLIAMTFGCVPLGGSNNGADMSVSGDEAEMMSVETSVPVNEGRIEGSCQDTVDEETGRDTVRIVYDLSLIHI